MWPLFVMDHTMAPMDSIVHRPSPSCWRQVSHISHTGCANIVNIIICWDLCRELIYTQILFNPFLFLSNFVAEWKNKYFCFKSFTKCQKHTIITFLATVCFWSGTCGGQLTLVDDIDNLFTSVAIIHHLVFNYCKIIVSALSGWLIDVKIWPMPHDVCPTLLT